MTMTATTIASAGVTYTICPEDEYAYAGSECPMCKDRKYGFFYDQLAEYEAALEAAGAVITSGGERFIDTGATVPALKGLPEVTLLTVYKGLKRFGYANGLL
jgi:hypothetical protein